MGLLIALAAAGAQVPLGRPKIQPLRQDEDWRPFCSRHPSTPGWDRLKCLGIGSDGATLTLGGELRLRGEANSAPGFSLNAPRDGALMYRVLLHADLRTDGPLRLFVQLGHAESYGRPFRKPTTDRDDLDVVQGFAELAWPVAGGTFALRAGRQEIALGSQRLVSVRAATNIRRSLDGLHLQFSRRRIWLEAFVLHPVRVAPRAFDDVTDRSERLSGAQLTLPLGGPLRADILALDFRRDHARFALATGRERRTSLGLRLFGRAGNWDWDVEAVRQTGSLDRRRIDAWTLASEIGLRTGGFNSVRFSLKANVASGARGQSDTLETFNAIYPRLPYFSEANLISPANVIDLLPSVLVHPTSRIDLGFGWDRFWRHRQTDGVYGPNLVPLPGSDHMEGRDIGQQAIIDYSLRAGAGITVSGQLVAFSPANGLRHVGATGGTYFSMQLSKQF